MSSTLSLSLFFLKKKREREREEEGEVGFFVSWLVFDYFIRGNSQLTLSHSLSLKTTDGDELDITPLRILVIREAWQCLPDGDVASCAVDAPEADGRANAVASAPSASKKASSSSSSSSPSITSRSTALSTAAALKGTWKVFDVCAHAIPPSSSSSSSEGGGGGGEGSGDGGNGESGPGPGGAGPAAAFDLDDPDEQVTAIYSTSRTVQRWTLDPTEFPGDGGGAYALPDARVAAAEVNASGGSESGAGDSSSAPPPPPPSSTSGPAPGAAVLELVMLDPVSRGADADAIEGMGGRWGKGKGEEGGGEGDSDDSDADSSPPPPLLRRALLVTALWSPRDGTVVGLQREYDAGGDLVEVRARTAVRTDVAGGSM